MSEIERLRTRIEILEEENRQLRDVLAPSGETPVTWGLSASMSRIFAALSVREFLSHEGIALCCSGPSDGERTDATVRVQVMRLRRRIRPYGYDVVRVWGRGYRLSRPTDAVADVCVAALRSTAGQMRSALQ